MPRPAYFHFLDHFLAQRRGRPRTKTAKPRVFVEQVRSFLDTSDFLCAGDTPCRLRVRRIEQDADERIIDLAVRFELAAPSEPPVPVPAPVPPGTSGPREHRCSVSEGSCSFPPLYHFTFRSDETVASNEKRFREFLAQLPPPDGAR